MSTTRSAQSQAIKFQNSLEMSKEHFDVLAIFERLLVSPGLGDVASDISCGFMDASAIFRGGVCSDNSGSLHRASRAI